MKKALLAALILTLLASSAWAAKPPLGLRAGYTSWKSTKQFHFGAHARLGELFPSVHFTPNLEMGFGDNMTVIAANGDLAYSFTELVNDPLGLYAGGSLSLIYTKPHSFESDFNLGLSGLAGVTWKFGNGNEGLAEVRFGILDSPGFKATLGYTFF